MISVTSRREDSESAARVVLYASTNVMLALNRVRSPEWMFRTAYLLQDAPCMARCVYCGISTPNYQKLVRSDGSVRIARVLWHPVKLVELLNVLPRFERVCLQTVLKPPGFLRTLPIVKVLFESARSLSVAIGAAGTWTLRLLAHYIDHVGIGLDAATPAIALLTQRPYRWEDYIRTIARALEVFGAKNVTVHLIVGLGENPYELSVMIEYLIRMKAEVALFPYTPLTSDAPRPSLHYYRGAQVYLELLREGFEPRKYLQPRNDGWLLLKDPPDEIILNAIMTHGCPSCNRPFYTESPRGVIYNYPYKPPKREVAKTLSVLRHGRGLYTR